MELIFKPLAESDFPLLLRWLSLPHVRKWWDPEVSYTLELIKQKYESYVRGYKLVDGVKRPIHAYVIYIDGIAVGYIQYFAWQDFPGECPVMTDDKICGIDFYIGEEEFLHKGFAQLILAKFAKEYLENLFDYCIIDVSIENITAQKAFAKAGFIPKQYDEKQQCWMIKQLVK